MRPFPEVSRRMALCGLGTLALTACSETRFVVARNADANPKETARTWRMETLEVSLQNAQIYFDGGGARDTHRLDHQSEEDAVERMFVNGVTSAAFAQMTGDRAVRVDVQVREFDALSSLERGTTGGLHRVSADLFVSDAGTGERLAQIEKLDMRRFALGGGAALVASVIGRGQEVRITERIAQVTGDWFASL